MRTIFLMLALSVLVGCTTPADLLKGEPIISATTSKSPRDYALCVFPQWQEHRAQAAMNETADGYRLLIAAEATGQTDELLEVRGADVGSEVRLYQRMAQVSIGRGAVQAAVRSCL